MAGLGLILFAVVLGVSQVVSATPDMAPATPALPAERPPPSEEIEPPSELVVPAPIPSRIKVVRPPPAPPKPSVVAPQPEVKTIVIPVPVAEPVDEVPPPAADEVGVLSIGSIQAGAEVYIQGQFVRQVPLKKELVPGRYVIGIIAPDGRTKRFVVQLESGEQVRKVWDFDKGSWR
jgi:hypothetical protein